MSQATARTITEAAQAVKRLHTRNGEHNYMTIDQHTIIGWTADRAIRFVLPDPVAGIGPDDRPTQVTPDDIIKVMKEYKPTQAVHAQVEADRVTVAGVTLPAVTNDPEERPDPLTAPDTEPILYGADRVAAVCKFASTDDLRPVLYGVRFNLDGVVATNSYILAEDTRTPGPVEGVTVPAKHVQQAARLTDQQLGLIVPDSDNPDLYGLTVTSKHGSSVLMVGRTVTGDYPNCSQLFPETWESTATVDMKAARDQATKIKRWAGKSNHPAVISGTPSAYTLKYDRPDGPTVQPEPFTGCPGGSATEAIDAIGVNSEFLADTLDFFAQDETTINLINPKKPVMFQGADRRALLMPIRLSS